MFSKEEIEQLRPEFTLNGALAFAMVDWFKFHIIYSNGKPVSCTICSGLRHADGVTRSPYHYDTSFFGDSCMEKSLIHFSVWWMKLHQEQKIF